MRLLFTLCCIVFLISCKQEVKIITPDDVTIDTLQGTSLFGTPLIRRQVDARKDSGQIAKYIDAYSTYAKDTTDVDALIWVGRRIAYLGDYQQAIRYYSKGISQYPQEARFYRHRGHRYISIRQFDKAIYDFNRAAQITENKKDIVEPDGIPNRLNTPTSTLQTNIYYHMGLAHYLKNKLPNAMMAFVQCLRLAKNDDMQVATRHWLYMIHRRLGNTKEATDLLTPIHKDMNIIENTAYHQLLLFYKGELTEIELSSADATGSSEAIQYGVANWHHYNDSITKATTMYQNLIKHGNWAGFGYVAAEADLKHLEQSKEKVNHHN